MIPTSIDGTDITGATIDGSNVTEITVDGDTVFTAGAVIPESVVDNFDSGNLNPYTNTNNWTVTQSNVIEGQNALAIDSGNPEFSDSALISESGLDAYPQKGDVIACLLRDPSDTLKRRLPAFEWGVDTDGGKSEYRLLINAKNNEILLSKRVNGSFAQLATASLTINAGDWYDCEVEWHDGSGDEPDNELIARIYEVDEIQLERNGGELVEISANDSDNANNTGIGFSCSSDGNSPETVVDALRIMGQVDTYDNPSGIII